MVPPAPGAHGARESDIGLRRRLLLGIAIVVLFAGGVLVDYLTALKRSEGLVAPGTEAGIGGRFALVDATGRAVTEADFADRYKLIFFGFTHCPDVCPTMLARMSVILRALGPAADHLYPLFITVDPVRDTPERLRDFGRLFDPRIVYLTGAPEQIASAQRETLGQVRALRAQLEENSARIEQARHRAEFLRIQVGKARIHAPLDATVQGYRSG